MEQVERTKTAAMNGHVKATWRLYRLYSSGNRYVSVDMEKALKWLTLLTDKNVPDSLEVMGDHYYFGRGVEQNDKTAAEWYEKYIKVEQDPDIVLRYATLLATGSGVAQDKLKAYLLLYIHGIDKDFVPAYLPSIQLYNELSPVQQFKARSFVVKFQRNKQALAAKKALEFKPEIPAQDTIPE